MNNLNSKTTLLPLTALLAGLLGLLLRFWLYATGLDEANLLIASHPAGILGTILTLAAVAAAVWGSRKQGPRSSREALLPPSAIGCIGSLIGAAGLLAASLVDLVRKESPLITAGGFLGLLAAAALAWAGYQRLRGIRSASFLHAGVCLYFLVRLISRYQTWSADPQLQNYCCQLLAIICLMLFSYNRCELDFHDRDCRTMLMFGLLSIYFCTVSLVRSDGLWLYLSMAVWTGTNLGVWDGPGTVPEAAGPEEEA